MAGCYDVPGVRRRGGVQADRGAGGGGLLLGEGELVGELTGWCKGGHRATPKQRDRS